MPVDPIRAVEMRLRAAVDSSPSGLLMTDVTGTIVLVNQEIERLFGYSREELLGRSVDILVPSRFRGQHPGFRRTFTTDPRVRAMGAGRDLFGVRKDGTEVPVEIGLTPVATEEGLFVLGSIVDITARKRAEEDRRQLEEQLRQAQKMEAVGTLAGGIAHDFNNILAAIFGYVEFLQHEVTSEQAKADIRDLFAAADRGKRLVQRILTFSRQQEILRRPLRLSETVAEAVRLLRATLPAAVNIRLNLHPETPSVLADPTAVHQVLMNLATNAAHAMPGGGPLEVVVEPFYVRDSVARTRPDLREGPYAVLTVRDVGQGMEPSVRERAFEPFFTTKAPGQGTGLGLAVVHGIMREHEGVVELQSEPGRGTAVRCLFPALVGEADEVALDEGRVERGRGERVLLIEDDAALAQVAERRLRHLGYQPVMETDSLQALARFREHPDAFDIVVTDYSMPALAGLDLARAVTEIRPGIPVLMITGFIEDLPGDVLQAAGVGRVVKKPLTLEQLASALSEMLAGR